MFEKIHRPLTRNAGIKLLSVLFAALLWYLAAGQERTEVSLIVPVELAGIPDGVVVEGGSLEFVQLRLRGSKAILQNLSPQSVRVKLNVGTLKPGDNVIPVTENDINIPRGVELVSINPSYLFTRAAAKKLVPVKVRLTGEPAPGYRVVSVAAIPSNIYIIGPPGRVNGVREVDTQPISIRDATGPVYAKADLDPPDSRIRLMELKPLEVTVIIEGRRIEKVFRGVPVTVIGGVQAVLQPPQIQVTLSGPMDLIRSLKPLDIRAELDLSNTPPGTVTRKPRVTVPEGTTLLDVTPISLKVTLP